MNGSSKATVIAVVLIVIMGVAAFYAGRLTAPEKVAPTPPGAINKLVGVGSFGIRAPILRGMWALYFVNPYSAGNIIIDEIHIIREDGVVTAEIKQEDIKTPKGQDNILEPYESWEFVSEEYTEVPPDAKRTYSAWVYWNSAEGYDNQLAGWWYQKILFGPAPGTEGLPQLSLLQYPMVNVIE